MSITRRQFLTNAGSLALTCAYSGPAGAVMGPNDKFDLVIKGGECSIPARTCAASATSASASA